PAPGAPDNEDDRTDPAAPQRGGRACGRGRLRAAGRGLQEHRVQRSLHLRARPLPAVRLGSGSLHVGARPQVESRLSARRGALHEDAAGADDARPQPGRWEHPVPGRPGALQAPRRLHVRARVQDPRAFPHPYFRVSPDYLGIYEDNDPAKRLLMIVNYNQDVSEYWEWSDTNINAIDLNNEAYKLGVDYVIYGMTH